MGDVVKRRILICITAVTGIGVLVTALLCFFGVFSSGSEADMGKLRSDAAILVSEIENGRYEIETSIPYAVVLNNGTVGYNGGTTLNETVNLHSLGASSQSGIYTVPLIKDGEAFAILYIEVPAEYYGVSAGEAALWICCGTVVIVLLLFLYLMSASYLKKDIFVPAQKLHQSTRDILNGNLDTPVNYDYDGEIGALCHDFELMRMELRDGFARERKMKNDEKLLMASISHDLKTPLASVQGYLESICIGVVSEPDEIRNYCGSALEKTKLLVKMTNDILEQSKSELRQLSIEPEEVYTADYFGSLLKTLCSDAKSRGFSFSYGEIPNLIVPLDRTRIAQVMENLVGNSLKYSRKNGSIEVEFRVKDGMFFVFVKDDGIGIAAEDLPFVFDRFFRGDKSRTQSISGSGLGLSIAKYIVEQHGGKIECDSVSGCGTTVEFCIPFDKR